MPARPTAVMFAVLLPCVAVAQEVPWQAERVMLRTDGVRAGRPVAGHLVRQGKELSADGVYTVSRADGGLLELVDNDGWVARADVMRMTEAAAYFTARIKEEPTAAKWYARRAAAKSAGALLVNVTDTPGRSRIVVGDPSHQLEDLREAVRLAPVETQYRYRLAGVLMALAELDQAAEQAEAIIRLAPEETGGYSIRAAIRMARKDAAGAASDVERVAELDPKSFATQMALALTYLHTGHQAKAYPLFRRASEMPVSSSSDYHQRAVARATVGNMDGMLADLNEALRLDPTRIETLRTRGCLLRRRGEYHAALADFRRTARLKPGDPAAMRMEAFLLCTCKDDALRDGKRAVELAEKVVKLAEKDSESANLEALAAAYAEVGDFSAAAAAQKRAMKALEGAADYYEEVAGLRWWLNQYEREQPRRE